MGTLLIITPVKKLQKAIVTTLKQLNSVGIYISLNRPYEATIDILSEADIRTQKIFFIDCVAVHRRSEDVLNINPDNISLLSSAISTFVDEITGKKFIFIDAVTNLLIYHHEDTVLKFLKDLKKLIKKEDCSLISLCPESHGHSLFKKIYETFDSVVFWDHEN